MATHNVQANYVSRPRARKDAPDVREHVGTINWFGVFDPMDGMHHHEGRVARTFRFDLSRALQALKLDNTRELTVTFEATSGLVASTKAGGPKGDGAKGVAPAPTVQFRSDAALSVGAVDIQ